MRRAVKIQREHSAFAKRLARFLASRLSQVTRMIVLDGDETKSGCVKLLRGGLGRGQALDYGASLWRHADFNQLFSTLDEAAERQSKMPFRGKLTEFFSLEEESVNALLESMRRNLSDGTLKFVVLMDRLEDRSRINDNWMLLVMPYIFIAPDLPPGCGL